MRKNKAKIWSIVLITLSIIVVGTNVFGHSGRTDSSGGHKDNKNKSGLGSYHYHCGGHPAHLHTNGVCPYSSSSSSNKNSTSGSSSSNTNTRTVPSTIAVTEIQINEKIENLEVGKGKILTATITPTNATDKSIIWKSSDENIATVSSTGEIVAKKPGTVDITAISSNGKTSTIKINIKEEPKIENSDVINASMTSGNITMNNTINNITTNTQENSNPLGGILALGLLSGGGYWGYKRYKKSKQ